MSRLTEDRIRKILTDHLARAGAAAGAAGGAVGGSAGAGAVAAGAGAAGAASGGARGAKRGVKHTSLDERRAGAAIPWTPTVADRVREHFGDGLIAEPGSDESAYIAGKVGSGFFRMNPCVVTVEDDGKGLDIRAYAFEGLLRQGTCRKAITRLQRSLDG